MENQNQNPEQEQQLQIELSPAVAEGVYANLAVLTHSHSEIVLDFISIMPGMPKANVKSRVVLAPEHAKRLLFALNDNIQKYEAEFGQILLPQPPEAPEAGRTAAPFGVPEGNA